MTLKGAVKRSRRVLGALRGSFRQPMGSDFTVGKLLLSDVRPVKPMRDGSALNKAGWLVLQARLENRQVKLYEGASDRHAAFIAGLFGHAAIGSFFPPVLGRQGAFVVAEWADGKPMAELMDQGNEAPLLAGLATMHAAFHSMEAPELPEPGFDYWHDLIRPRFSRATGLLGLNSFAAEIVSLVDSFWRNTPKVLMHPDLTPRNVICGTDGRLTVIDNELVCVGPLPLLDVCNTALALGSQLAQDYVKAYRELAQPTRKHDPNVLEAIWLARMVSSSFVSGNVGRVANLIARHRDGESLLPPLYS